MAISTDTSVYIAGVTTYVSPVVSAIASDATEISVSYPVGVGHTHSRNINVPRLANGNVDEAEWESRLDSHLLSINNKINVGAISTVPTEDDSPGAS